MIQRSRPPRKDARRRQWRAAWLAIGLSVTLSVTLLVLATWGQRAWAFDLDGHSVLEAAAYRRLLALEQVPDTSLSGRALIAALIARGFLVEPKCFGGARPRIGCEPDDRRDIPLAFWPALRAGAADLVLDRQLTARGQCQHFMAETTDGLAATDPRLGVPGALATDAYTRCIGVLGLAFEGMLRNPRLAHHRLVGMYALIHAIQDSFSPAHVNRDRNLRIVHLTSWTLLDWPSYFQIGRFGFAPETHHALKDDRDAGYLRAEALTEDGRRCSAIHNPYAVPEICLTPLGRAAVDAVVDLLVLTHQLQARARASGREASLAAPEDLAAWKAFLTRHLSSVAAPVEPPPPGLHVGVKRADAFVGAQVSIAPKGWGVGPWAARLFFGPAVPFALMVSGGVAFNHGSDGNAATLAAAMNLALPLARRFTIGVAPAFLAFRCDISFDRCSAGAFATLGDLIIPVGTSTWLGLQGPRWSWAERAVRGPWVALALGWSHEQGPVRDAPPTEAALRWDPPPPDGVRAYRYSRGSGLMFLTATVASTDENRWVGGGLELRRDVDRWGRRAGFSLGLSLALQHGTIEGSEGRTLAIAPTVRVYLLPDRLALAATPALVRVGTMAGHAFAADVAGTLSVALTIRRLELSLASPPLSYVSPARRHSRPIVARLGFLLE